MLDSDGLKNTGEFGRDCANGVNQPLPLSLSLSRFAGLQEQRIAENLLTAQC